MNIDDEFIFTDDSLLKLPDGIGIYRVKSFSNAGYIYYTERNSDIILGRFHSNSLIGTSVIEIDREEIINELL